MIYLSCPPVHVHHIILPSLVQSNPFLGPVNIRNFMQGHPSTCSNNERNGVLRLGPGFWKLERLEVYPRTPVDTRYIHEGFAYSAPLDF